MPPTNGIVHAAGSPGNREYLVLEEVKAKVMIIDGDSDLIPRFSRSVAHAA
jgi:hypothetical protein